MKFPWSIRTVPLPAVVGSAIALAAACTSANKGGSDNGNSTAATTSTGTMGGAGGTAAAGTTTGTAGMGGTGTTTASGTGGVGAGGTVGGGTTSDTGGAGANTGGTGGGDTGGTGGSGGTGGTGGTGPVAPEHLSETGLFSTRGSDGELVLEDGVQEFQPKYWLWSDGSDKRRYVYLPEGSQIDTSDPDHWVMPAGAKLWKSFIMDGQLVETRLIEWTGDGPNDLFYATYFWDTVDATDATKVPYGDQLQNAAGTTHDIPNGFMCERCHNGIKDHALGFSALQLNHDLGGLNLETLMNDGWLTDAISLDIKVPGDDQLTQDALGYLHANCGNCHNDSPGVAVENLPQPQMMIRLSVNDQTFEDTGVYKTVLNQPTTATSSTMLGYDTRIVGGDPESSTVYYRMTLRMVEDQMPPIGTQITDPDGLTLIQSWIESLPPPQ